MLKNFLKSFLSAKLLRLYHQSLTYLSAVYYGRPSNKLIVIGVTGTNGKSTVCNLIGHLLTTAGYKTAVTSTVSFKIAEQEWLNDQKMTMLGRHKLQKLLAQAVKAGCTHAVIETSSQGLEQGRHLGLNYDLAVFTNLTPEHIEAHGGFEKYKQAKALLFKYLNSQPKKKIKQQLIDKAIISNLDDPHGLFFLNFPADKKITYALNQGADLIANQINLSQTGSSFFVPKLNTAFQTKLIGEVNVYNCLAALAVAWQLKIPAEILQAGLASYQLTPGRFELINEGQSFQVMIDYAPEPESLKKLFTTLKLFNYNHLIHVLGSCGGGRDVARRPILGELSAQHADYIIVTNEDPYDDDPEIIIEQVAAGALKSQNFSANRLFKISERGQAIKKALELARANDLVLITGKGSEQFICGPNGSKTPWDDRQVTRRLLKKLQNIV